jgi:hypothetical protein
MTDVEMAIFNLQRRNAEKGTVMLTFDAKEMNFVASFVPHEREKPTSEKAPNFIMALNMLRMALSHAEATKEMPD